MAHTNYNPHKRDKNHPLDKLIYPISLFAPIVTIPQLIEVWQKRSVAGISLTTWGAYTFVSGIWFMYGMVHKEKPLILANFLLMVLDALVVIGVLLFR